VLAQQLAQPRDLGRGSWSSCDWGGIHG
jgi:hypothetical protein